MTPPTEAIMPGAWICPKCRFTLQKNTMDGSAGEIYADASPLNEVCPNDGVLMRPLTWREVNIELFNRCVLEMNRLDWLDKHCSFVADAEYNLGPFKVGELRKLADAGLEADKKKEQL